MICLRGYPQNVQYTYLSDVECISETGAADNVYIFVCGKDRYSWLSFSFFSNHQPVHTQLILINQCGSSCF